MSSAKTTSPTPSPTPRTSMAGLPEKVSSPENFRQSQEGHLSPRGSPKGDRAWLSERSCRTPIHERATPPTLEEIEAMESQGILNRDQRSSRSPPAAYPLPVGFQPQVPTPRIQSRQVLRVSGTGRTAMHDQHTEQIKPAPQPEDEQSLGPSERIRRLLSIQGSDSVNRPGHLNPPSAQSNSQGEQQLPKQRMKRELEGPLSFRVQQDATTKPIVARWVDNRVEQSRRVIRENAQRRVPYAYGTPSSWEERSKKVERPSKCTVNQQQGGINGVPDDADGGDGQGCVCGRVAVAAPSDDQPRSSSARGAEREASHVRHEMGRRSSSDPNLAASALSQVHLEGVELEAAKEAKDEAATSMSRRSSGEDESPPSVTCWGGGLPPRPGPNTQAPSGAKPAPPRVPVPVERKSERRTSHDKYPASDKESFARTLNSEELEEVWQGLGEGVSQRGLGSEVSFPAGPQPTSPRTSGGFPKLTANALKQFERLAEQQRAGAEGPIVINEQGNVMPVPKDVNNDRPEDLEAGSPSSKKSGSSRPQLPSVLSAIVAYGMLVLWAAHLVFNILLLWKYLQDEPVWVLCFLPGMLGIILSVKGCRRAHRCEVERGGNPSRGRHTSHLSLPAHLLLVIMVVVALSLHASGLLVCEHEMTLFLTQNMLGSMCEERSLLFPVILDCVLLAVTSLKSSSLCWAWILS